MSKKVIKNLVPEEVEAILVMSYVEERWFTLSQLGRYGSEIDKSTYRLKKGGNFICLCSLRDQEYGVSWEDDPPDQIRYRVIPSKFPTLYVLEPLDAPNVDEMGKILPGASPPKLKELGTTVLMRHGIGPKQAAVIQPGLVWAMFKVTKLNTEMEEMERREMVPMCQCNFHSWEDLVDDYYWESNMKMKRLQMV